MSVHPADPAPFVIEEYVRWSDVDFAGIIFYGSYVRLFEIAETELFRAAGLPYGTMFDTLDIFLPRVQVHTEFLEPTRLDDSLKIAVYIGRVGRRSLTMNFEVLLSPAGRHCAHGHLVLVCTDRTSMKSRSLPTVLLEKLAPFTLSAERARAQLGIAPPPVR